jgi:hypothetical protein
MAERQCPVCKKRPVWRTNQSNNWRHLCKRCYHKAWAADQKAQRAARRATRDRDTGDTSSSDLSCCEHGSAPQGTRHLLGESRLKKRRRG